MARTRTVNVILVILAALVIVEAGALASVLNERSSMSNELRTRSEAAEMSQYLVVVSARLQHEVSLMDRATAQAASMLQGSSLNGSKARGVLNDAINASSNIINVLTADRNGTVLAIEPAQYSYIEGMSLGEQEPVRKLLDEARPVMSPLMEVLEGYDAVFIAHPVVDDQGTLVGAVSTLFRPDRTVENITGAKGALNVMVMRSDGVVLYDPDADQVGRNTFTDPLYQDHSEIKALAYRMANESSGSGGYTFKMPGSANDVHKKVLWTTIAALGERWTVAVNRAA